ncbi:HNH endonuclease [Paenibacillus sp. GCM10027626]|uniref:HNH endonuclease n=1 Tax=Paenibacillus sp. GCM10027626 TaxID=3273411 RepID=UPI00363A0C65
MTKDEKQCAACGEIKSVSSFTKRSGRNSRRGTCRQCLRRRQRRELRTAKGAEVAAAELAATAAGPIESAPRKRRRRRRRKQKGREVKIGKANASLNNNISLTVEKAELPPQKPPFKKLKPMTGPFTFNTKILNDRGTGLIRLRGRRETGKRWSTEIPYEMAVQMVDEGAAGILHARLIHKLYTKADFRIFILQRDNYQCRYCGCFGDTIDHVIPKSKGGLTSPVNCVCACAECNLKKADHLDFVFDDF